MQLNHLIKTAARKLINTGQVSNSKLWQGVENKNPLFQAIKVYLGPAQMPDGVLTLQTETEASKPWAENQFQERTSSIPLNPGETYKEWPWYGQDATMRPEGKFTHTYMERFWPKYAGIAAQWGNNMDTVNMNGIVNGGIRYEYGDLNDLIKLFLRDPETRQAFLPIFFPEDTGNIHGGRIPCTLGYLFQIVNDKLHMTYYIRSCDIVRHFRDDIYMAVRLAQHILLSLKLMDNRFQDVSLGLFDMHIGSLHCFHAEIGKIEREFNIL